MGAGVQSLGPVVEGRGAAGPRGAPAVLRGADAGVLPRTPALVGRRRIPTSAVVGTQALFVVNLPKKTTRGLRRERRGFGENAELTEGTGQSSHGGTETRGHTERVRPAALRAAKGP